MEIRTSINSPGDGNRDPPRVVPSVTLKNIGDQSAKDLRLIFRFLPMTEVSLDDTVLRSKRFKKWDAKVFSHGVPFTHPPLPVRHKALTLRKDDGSGGFIHTFSMVEVAFLDHLLPSDGHPFPLKEVYTAAEIYMAATLPNGGPQAASNAQIDVELEYEDVKGMKYLQQFWILLIARQRKPWLSAEATPSPDYNIAADITFEIQERVLQRVKN